MRIDIKTDATAVTKLLRTLPRELADKAMARTLNAAVAQGKTRMVREISGAFAVKAAFVRERLVIKRARFKGASFVGEAELLGSEDKRGRERSLNVIHFAARQTGVGVSLKIRRDAGRKTIKGAFIGNNGRTVFERVPGTSMRSRRQYAGTMHAQTIRPVQTIGVPQMFNTRRINTVVVQVLQDKLLEIAQREVRFVLIQAGAAK